MINSKKKGNRFELEIAKVLTNLTGSQWYRVGVSSGARFTTIGAEKFRGDITTDDPGFQQYVIETKAIKGRVTFEDIVNPKSKLNVWIEQAIAESQGKQWVLFFKANNGNIFAVTLIENDFGANFLKNKEIGTIKQNNNTFVIYLIE